MLRAMPDARRHDPPAEKRTVSLSVVEEGGRPDDDLALVKKIAAGDEAAFEQLVTRYQDRVFSFCYRLLNDRAEAEDVAQDVFFTLYRSAGDFRGESAFATWLLRIAKNQSLNRIKYLDRRGRMGRRSLEEVREERLAPAAAEREPPAPDALVEGEQTAAIVQSAIAELDPQHRAVVVLRDVEDLSYEEIAGITGLPIGTVKSRIHRARGMLKELVEKELGEKIG
jgi:RNA polymerase sigma-70 factor (ECF subfamily)